MAWIPTSVPAKIPPTVSWDELAELEKAGPGLTRLPPYGLVSSSEVDSIRRELLSTHIVSEALAEAHVGRKKRAHILRKIAGKPSYPSKISSPLYKSTKHEAVLTNNKKEAPYVKAQ